MGLSALLEETARSIFPDIGFNSFCTGTAVFSFNIKPLNYAEGQNVSPQQPFRRTYKSMAKCIFKNLAYISNVILVHIEDIPIWSVLIASALIFFEARYMFVYNLALPALFWILFSDGLVEKLTENTERVLQKEGK